jgi:hypothetical protein
LSASEKRGQSNSRVAGTGTDSRTEKGSGRGRRAHLGMGSRERTGRELGAAARRVRSWSSSPAGAPARVEEDAGPFLCGMGRLGACMGLLYAACGYLYYGNSIGRLSGATTHMRPSLPLAMGRPGGSDGAELGDSDEHQRRRSGDSDGPTVGSAVRGRGWRRRSVVP